MFFNAVGIIVRGIIINTDSILPSDANKTRAIPLVKYYKNYNESVSKIMSCHVILVRVRVSVNTNENTNSQKGLK